MTLDYCFHLACLLFLLKDADAEVHYDRYELPPFWGTGRRNILSRLSRYRIPPTAEAFKELYVEHMYVMLSDRGDSEGGRASWDQAFSNRFNKLRHAFSQHTVLTVSGMEIGTVREVTSVSRRAAWRLAGTHGGASDNECRDRRAMVLRTLAADMLDKPVDWSRIEVGEETNNGTRLGAIWFGDVAIRAEELIRTRYAIPEERAGVNMDAAFVERLDELIRWIGLMSKGNSLFVTNTEYIGLGRNEVSVEDKVYVLHQGWTPFLLRRSDSRFT
ncbi:hypothetical protein B0T10DRAFT_467719 [Thelonectria olida]|uniref:Uncharacterized protein n=1 Tax=Thelonectria olida TaxID=1576542 RepID=A0A9P8VRA8_9HYPO|nr:hypothetical protein B0T10DRAFT_467719 [Thelonectria olida]